MAVVQGGSIDLHNIYSPSARAISASLTQTITENTEFHFPNIGHHVSKAGKPILIMT